MTGSFSPGGQGHHALAMLLDGKWHPVGIRNYAGTIANATAWALIHRQLVEGDDPKHPSVLPAHIRITPKGREVVAESQG